MLIFILVMLLICLNGFFAISEISIISSRISKLKELAAAGNNAARTALRIADSPSRFITCVQVFMTLIAILIGLFGGEHFAAGIYKFIYRIPFLTQYAYQVSLGLVIFISTSASMIIGEIIPKKIGLINPESWAMRIANPMSVLLKIFFPLINVFESISEGVVYLIKRSSSNKYPLSDEEIQVIIADGVKSGVFEKIEMELVETVLHLDNIVIEKFMTPADNITWINTDESID